MTTRTAFSEQGGQPVTVGWALRRMAIAIVILLTIVSGAAGLMYAGIEPDEPIQIEPTERAIPETAIVTPASTLNPDEQSVLHMP